MFGQINNKSTEASTNTSFITLFGSISSLSIGGWNDKISVRISPSSGVDANGVRRYDFQRRVNTAIPFSQGLTFVEGIEKVVFPAIENSIPDKGTAIEMGSNNKKNIVEISTFLTDDGKISVKLSINTISDTGNSIIEYIFGTTQYRIRNTKTGGEEEYVTVQSELMEFYTILKNQIQVLGLGGHGYLQTNAMKAQFTNRSNQYTNNYTNQQPNNQDVGNAGFMSVPEDSDDSGLPF